MLQSLRIITDQNGQVVSRRDFMPFGEDLPRANYGNDNNRFKFTTYQKDNETGLDFAEARYYNNAQGRFTAVDPLLASGKSADPQSFISYIYSLNSPLIMSDPTGLFGDYYDRNLNYIGSDGKDDGKYYYADILYTDHENRIIHVGNTEEFSENLTI